MIDFDSLAFHKTYKDIWLANKVGCTPKDHISDIKRTIFSLYSYCGFMGHPGIYFLKGTECPFCKLKDNSK